jgi:hypothetical protein
VLKAGEEKDIRQWLSSHPSLTHGQDPVGDWLVDLVAEVDVLRAELRRVVDALELASSAAVEHRRWDSVRVTNRGGA